MPDLESAIHAWKEFLESDHNSSNDTDDTVGSKDEYHREVATLKPGDSLTGLFEYGAYLRSVNYIDEDHINCDFLAKVTGSNGRSLWKWPSISNHDNQTIHIRSVLPMTPVIDIAYTTSRNVIL